MPITPNKLKERIAECVGLWRAEGDTKCSNEITFTNNSIFLILYFHKTLIRILPEIKNKVRIYIYSPNFRYPDIPLKNIRINKYLDARATKPYFIWRVASVTIYAKWKTIADRVTNSKKYCKPFLRGFFAGEGNIKAGSHGNRTIRIAQGKPSRLIEKLLTRLKLKHKYRPAERSYSITGRTHWELMAKYKLADLHPEKKIKFRK